MSGMCSGRYNTQGGRLLSSLVVLVQAFRMDIRIRRINILAVDIVWEVVTKYPPHVTKGWKGCVGVCTFLPPTDPRFRENQYYARVVSDTLSLDHAPCQDEKKISTIKKYDYLINTVALQPTIGQSQPAIHIKSS